MSDEHGHLPDEERRLREYLEAGNGIHPGHSDDKSERLEWPEDLALNHPEIFPRRRERQPRIGVGTRRLLWVVVPVVLALVWAEATDSVIGSAWLLALLASLIGLSFWVGFLAPPWLRPDEPGYAVVLGFDIYYRAAGQAGFLVLLGVFGMASYFGWREHRTVDKDLARIVPPVPEIVDVTYVPTAGEIRVLETALGALGNRGVPRPRVAGGDSEAVAPVYWIVKTKLDTGRVAAFYDEAAPPLGWDVASGGRGIRTLRRGAERLIIFTTDDWPRPHTKVLYIHSAGGG